MYYYLSLKDIGKFQGYVNELNGFSSLVDVLKSGKSNKGFNAIRDSLKGLTVDEATQKLQNLKLNPNLSKELLNAANNGKLLKGSADEIVEGIRKVGESTDFIDDVGLAFQVLWSKMSPILTAIATNPFTWAIVGGLALAGVIDYLTVSYDEANKALDEANEKYKETESSISSLNDEFSTNEEKIEELRKLESDGIITDSQKEELKNLENKNEQLKTQIALQKELLELQNQDKAEAAKDVANAKSHSVAQSVKMGDETGESTFKQTVGSVTDPEAIKEDLALIDEYELKLSSLEEDLINAQKDVSNAESPFAKWTAELKVSNIKDEIQKYKDSLATLYEDLQTRSTNAQETLESLKLNPDANAAEIEIYETALASMETQLLDVKEAIESVNSMTISPSLSKEEMISQLNDMSEGFEELDKIYKSIKDDAPFDFKLLDDENFKNTFSGLDGYAEFFETITSNADDIDACQEAFNDLVSEWIDRKGILKGVTEENASLTASMLEQMGVVNASQIVTDVLKDQENATKFLESAEIDLVNATAEEINSLNILDGELAQSGGAIYDVYLKKKLTSENPIDTSADCNALIAMARQCQVTGENLALLIKLKNTYLTLESDMWGDATKQIAAKEAERLKAQLANTSFAADYKPVVSYKAPSTGKSSGSSSAAKDTKETFDWIERAIKKVQRTITNLGKTVSATYKTWTTRNSALTQQISAINSEISIQQKAYDYYMKKASEVGLSSSYVKKIQDGTINIETIKDESLINKIKEYQDLYDKALAAKDAITDLNDEIAALAKTRFDNVVTQFDEQISLIEHETSVLDALISQTEASGHVVSASFYEQLIGVENKNLATLKKEYTALQNALNQAMAEGKIEKYSSDWYDMVNSINDVELAIIESNTALIEYQKNIRDLEWAEFDRMQEQISQITNESEFLIDLLSHEDLFNDDGSATKYGQATFGLHAVNYNTSLEQAKKYYEELSDIRAQLVNDADNVDLLAREEELREAFQDTALAAKQQEQALIELAEEGYNKMLDYMSELIDKQKDLLNSQKDLFDYEKNVREQTEEIARLEKIAQAVANDDSEEGRLRAQQNAVALKEAREALQETEYDRYIQDQEKLYDQILGDTEQWIDERLSKPEQLLADIVSAVNQNSASILEVLKGETAEVGGALSEEMSSIWGEDTNTVKKPEESTDYLSEALAAVSKEFEKLKSDETLSASGDITEILQEIERIKASIDGGVPDVLSATEELEKLHKETERIKASMAEGDSDVVSTYTDGISDNMTSILKVLGRIEDFVGDMDDESYQLLMKEINNSINDTSNGVSGSTQGSSNSSSGSNQSSSTSSSASNSSSSTSSDSSNWGSWFISKKNSVPDSQLKIDSSLVDRLKYLDYDSSFSARAKYFAAMGLGTASAYTGSAKQNQAMIAEMKKHGFNRGGRIGSLISATGEDGFVLANTGEYIFAEKDFKALSDMMAVAEPFIKTTMQLPTSLGSYNNNISNDVQLNISMYGIQDVDGLVGELKSNKGFEKVIQTMTIGKIAGINSLSKNKY